MDIYQRGSVLRSAIGSLVGGATSIAIYYYGQAYMFAHTQAKFIAQYYYLYFFGRVPWIMLMGVALAVVGYLATVRLDYRNDQTPIIARTVVIGLGLTIVVVTIQQFIFQGGSFFYDFFVSLLLNAGWFVLVALIPFVLTAIFLQFGLGFVRRPRSAREIMPPELLAQLDQRQRKRRK